MGLFFFVPSELREADRCVCIHTSWHLVLRIFGIRLTGKRTSGKDERYHFSKIFNEACKGGS